MIKRNKYFNKKIKINGKVWDSQKEYDRFCELVMLEKAGEIKDLQRQVRFEIVPKYGDERAAYYVADFVYTKPDGKKVIEDLKSSFTRTLPLFRLKWKLMKYIYKDYECIIKV